MLVVSKPPIYDQDFISRIEELEQDPTADDSYLNSFIPDQTFYLAALKVCLSNDYGRAFGRILLFRPFESEILFSEVRSFLLVNIVRLRSKTWLEYFFSRNRLPPYTFPVFSIHHVFNDSHDLLGTFTYHELVFFLIEYWFNKPENFDPVAYAYLRPYLANDSKFLLFNSPELMRGKVEVQVLLNVFDFLGSFAKDGVPIYENLKFLALLSCMKVDNLEEEKRVHLQIPFVAQICRVLSNEAPASSLADLNFRSPLFQNALKNSFSSESLEDFVLTLILERIRITWRASLIEMALHRSVIDLASIIVKESQPLLMYKTVQTFILELLSVLAESEESHQFASWLESIPTCIRKLHRTYGVGQDWPHWNDLPESFFRSNGQLKGGVYFAMAVTKIFEPLLRSRLMLQSQAEVFTLPRVQIERPEMFNPNSETSSLGVLIEPKLLLRYMINSSSVSFTAIESFYKVFRAEIASFPLVTPADCPRVVSIEVDKESEIPLILAKIKRPVNLTPGILAVSDALLHDEIIQIIGVRLNK